ncbi:SfnB family sulfur acquisition oxidoreductase [Herbaspirillum sp. RTI4]|uniref:SfnB family sulfur acquisition oxidoreductase n=1 Tax=Herbaspirillum sp. RTI4 TaxID=3048640 RepID=UPI002AB40072|nr:SfnB family sulfur acquisition oxidoreductase [Herbaspirillum sp. RTI4]MDY7578462.1 SfnB family sulfur acquisition oxidoreductase [Herbaspirillum sp. RTI4]MEA9981509.1 SfnB family sulfur acquisition oxidoreductase [Herbaspirillum sp. RTI4]
MTSLRDAQPAHAAHIITSDEEALQLAHQLAKEFAPGAAARDAERLLPWGEIEQFSASGLWGITVPKEYGGAGVSNVTLAAVIAIIGAADSSLAQIPQNHFYALEVLRVGGSPEQLQFFYALALQGQRFGNALAEIGHKDYKRRTHLAPDAEKGGFRISGRKFYCTGALYAQWIPTLVVDHNEITFLAFVPRQSPGVTIIDDWDGFGQRLTGSGSVEFDQVWVDADWVVPFKASFDRPTTIGPLAQLLHAAIDQGIAQGAYAATLDFVRAHARPWIDSGDTRAVDDPLTLERVGDLAVRLRAADALLRRAGRAVDQAQAALSAESVASASIAVAEARVLTTGISLLAGTRLFELGGSGASLSELNLDRFWRNARTHTLHDPVRWKFHAVGNYYLNDVLPPRQGTI